jgi:hypothetical protein
MVNLGGFEVTTSTFDNWTVTTKDRSLSAQWEHTILADYRLRHLVNNATIHIYMYTYDYIIMEITVLHLKISRHQLLISTR